MKFIFVLIFSVLITVSIGTLAKKTITQEQVELISPLVAGTNTGTVGSSSEITTRDSLFGWQVFVNNYYGYKIKHPQSVSVKNKKNGDIDLQKQDSINISITQDVLANNDTVNTVIEKAIDKKSAEQKERFSLVYSISPIALSSVTAQTYTSIENGAQRINTDNDIIPPQSPIISALPDATNSAGIMIEGFTEVGANVELLLNDSIDKITKADMTGTFVFETSLKSGQNRIQLRAKDEKGNESMSEVTLITYDNKPLELVVTSPKDGSEYFGKINQVIDVKGEVDKDSCQVLINGSFVQVDRSGAFLHRFMLTGGENIIRIVASDKAGNTAEKSLRLIYTP